MASASDNVASNGASFTDITLTSKFLGRGSFGDVYGPCFWKGNTCAIKRRLYTKEIAMEKDRVACEKWMKLDHINLITVYAVTYESPALFVVMEFASAGSLKETLQECKSDLSLKVVKNWGKQIAEGMAYLHENDIVHRDLKSPNIVLLDSDPVSTPNEKTLKITDFDQIRELCHTTKVSGIGTYAWKAPEVIKKGKFSKASDVWSFGVVLWEILTRKIPHYGLDDSEIIKKMQNKQLKLKIQCSSPDIVKKILIRCLCYKHKSRTSFEDICKVLMDPPCDEVLNQWTEKENNGLLKTTLLLIKDKTTVLQSDHPDGEPSIDNQRENHQPEEHKTRIKSRFDQLSKRLIVTDVAILMLEQDKLTVKQHERLRKLRDTPTAASEELLNIVMKSRRDVYECFLQSLQKTEQHDLYKWLKSDGSFDELCVSEHGRLIQKNYQWLLQTIYPGADLLANLFSRNVLNEREYDQLSTEKQDFEKNNLLLSIISRKSAENFQKFITALNVAQQQHVVAKLTSEPLGLNDPADVDGGAISHRGGQAVSS